MRVFLTGATGYIGSHVALELQRRGHSVIGLTRNEAASRRLQHAGSHAVIGDMADAVVLRDSMRDAEAVVHCGFDRGPHATEIERAALRVMLEAAAASRHQAFVYTSGVWVYGSRGDALVGEDAPLSPTPLAAWRPAHERLVLGAAGPHLRTIVIRPAIVYGDEGGIVGNMLDQARRGPVRVIGDGLNRWSCVRADALAELYVLALERSRGGAIYNATSGAAVPYVEIARAVARAAGGNGTVEHLTLEQGRNEFGALADALAIDLQVSSERARQDLGWEPHRPTVLEELSATTVV